MFARKLLKCAGLAALFVTVCSFWPFSNSSTVKMTVKTLDTTNEGAPFYFYIKEVEKGPFLKHEYHDVVKEAFPSGDETPENRPQVIIPGKKYTLNFTRKNPEKLLGVYFLFTNPGDDWKMLVNPSSKVEIVLGDTEILSQLTK